MKKPIVFLFVFLAVTQNVLSKTNATESTSHAQLFENAFKHIASNQKKSSSQAIHVINLLSQNPQVSLDQTNKYGSTLLHSAARYNKTNVIEKLLDLGAKIIENSQGQTPLDILLEQFEQADNNKKKYIKKNIRTLLRTATPETISRSFTKTLTAKQFSLFFEILDNIQHKSISDTDIDTILHDGTPKQKIALISALGLAKKSTYAQYINELLFTATIQDDRQAIDLLLKAGGDPSAMIGNSSALHRVVKNAHQQGYKQLLEKFLDHAQQQSNISGIFRSLNNKELIQLFSNKLKITNHDLVYIFKEKKRLFPVLSQFERDKLLQHAVHIKNQNLISFMISQKASKDPFIKGTITINDRNILRMLDLTQKQLFTLYSIKLNNNRAAIATLHNIAEIAYLNKCFELAVKKRKASHIREFIKNYSDKNFLYSKIQHLSHTPSTFNELKWLIHHFKDQRRTMSKFLSRAIKENKPKIVQYILETVTFSKPEKTLTKKFRMITDQEMFKHFMAIKEDIINPDVIISRFLSLLQENNTQAAESLLNAIEQAQRSQINFDMVNQHNDSLLDIALQHNILINKILNHTSLKTKQKSFFKTQSTQMLTKLINDKNDTKISPKFIIDTALAWYNAPQKHRQLHTLIEALEGNPMLVQLLHHAIDQEQANIIEHIIARGVRADSTLPEQKETALHAAVRHGNEEIVTLLLSATKHATTKQEAFKAINRPDNYKLYKIFLTDNDIHYEFIYDQLMAQQSGLFNNLSDAEKETLLALAINNNNSALASQLKTESTNITHEQISSSLNNLKMITALELSDQTLADHFNIADEKQAKNIIQALSDTTILTTLLIESVQKRNTTLTQAILDKGISPTQALDASLFDADMIKFLYEKSSNKEKDAINTIFISLTSDNDTKKAQRIIMALKDYPERCAHLLKIAATAHQGTLVTIILKTINFKNAQPYQAAFNATTTERILKLLLDKYNYDDDFIVQQLIERPEQRNTILAAIPENRKDKNTFLEKAFHKNNAQLIQAILAAGANKDKVILYSLAHPSTIETILKTEVTATEILQRAIDTKNMTALEAALDTGLISNEIIAIKLNNFLQNNTKEADTLVEALIKRNIELTKHRKALFNLVDNKKFSDQLALFFKPEIEAKKRAEDEKKKRLELKMKMQREQERKQKEAIEKERMRIKEQKRIRQERKNKERIERETKAQELKAKENKQKKTKPSLVTLRNDAFIQAAQEGNVKELTKSINKYDFTQETLLKAYNQTTNEDIFRILQNNQKSKIFITDDIILDRASHFIKNDNIKAAQTLQQTLNNRDIANKVRQIIKRKILDESEN